MQRKPKERAKNAFFTPSDMISNGEAMPEMIAYLWFGVEMRCSILFSGTRECDKRPYLEMISFFLPSKARIISISKHRWRFYATEDWQDIHGPERDFARLIGSIPLEKADFILVDGLDDRALRSVLKILPSRPVISTLDFNDMERLLKNLRIPRKQLTKLDLISFVGKANGNDMKLNEIVEIIGWTPKTPDKIALYKPYWWQDTLGEFFFQGHSYLYERYCEARKIKSKEIMRLILERADLLKWLSTKPLAPEEIRREILNYCENPRTIENCRKELRAVGHPTGKPLRDKAKIEWL